MSIRSENLARHLQSGLRPLYLVFGDEPLLALEAADDIRKAAREAGFTEREVFFVESGFDWTCVQAAGANLSLFGAGRLMELRITSGKPGIEGAKALQKLCGGLTPDTVVLVLLPGLDRKTQDSAWFRALSEAGVAVQVFPVTRERLPGWIGQRLARQGQRADPDTLAFIAERVEGNLLAADQEVKKLALLHPPGTITLESVRAAVVDVARFDVFQLSDAFVAGDLPRFSRVLHGLRAEGEPPPRVVWALARDLEALSLLKSSPYPGAEITRVLGLWESRRRAVQAAAERLDAGAISGTLTACAELDRQAKGLGGGDPWEGSLALFETLWGVGISARRRIAHQTVPRTL